MGLLVADAEWFYTGAKPGRKSLIGLGPWHRMLTLLHYPLCPFSRAIRLALAECDLAAELVEERPWEWRAEHLRINPAGTLPVLLEEGMPTVIGSYAISEYLAETDAAEQARGFDFFPGEPHIRSEVRRLVDWFHVKFAAEVTTYLLEEKVYRRFDESQGGAPDMDAVRAAQANLRHHLRYIGHLADERNWLAGNSLSFADFAAAAHISCVDFLGDVPWDESEAAKTWYARIKSRPSFRALLEDKIPGLVPPDGYADPDF